METEILTPFLNRAGDFNPEDWFQLVPKGVFPITRKEGDEVKTYIQIVDDLAVNRIVAAFTNRKAGNPAFKVLIDFEHFSHDTSKSSEAACWVNEMEARADGVWAKGEWSDTGAAAIKNRRYRYLSPVWFPRQTERIDAKRFRPVEVNDAGLTNKPNLGEALQPFWNREEFHGREATNHKIDRNMQKIIALLGLAATATEDEIVSKVQAYKNRIAELEPLSAQLSTLQGQHTALKNRHDTLLNSAVEKTLVEFKGVITEESKDAWKNRLTQDFDGTVSLLKGIKPAAAAKKPVHKDGKQADTTVDTTSQEQAFTNRTNAITARAQELKSQQPTRSFDSCWQQASRENPVPAEAAG